MYCQKPTQLTIKFHSKKSFLLVIFFFYFCIIREMFGNFRKLRFLTELSTPENLTGCFKGNITHLNKLDEKPCLCSPIPTLSKKWVISFTLFHWLPDSYWDWLLKSSHWELKELLKSGKISAQATNSINKIFVLLWIWLQ